MNGFELFNRNLCIDRSRLQFFVAEELLDEADVGSAFEHVGCAGVSQRVNTLLINSARLGSDTDFILFLIVKFR